MIYKCFKRFKDIALNGQPINIPYGSECECDENGLLIYKQSELLHVGVMLSTSENAFNYFMPDSVMLGNWENRVKYYNAIREKTSGPSSMDPSKPTMKDLCFDIIWNDEIANKYRKETVDTEWVFDRAKFHMATESDLKHIWELMKYIREPGYEIKQKPVTGITL